MKRKKLVALSLLVAVMTASLAGCGSSSSGTSSGSTSSGSASSGSSSQSSSSEASGESETTITYMTNTDFISTLEPIVEKYYEETGVKVVLEGYTTTDIQDVIEVKISSGTTDYDVLAVDVPLVSAYVNRGYLAPMDEYFTDEERAQLTDASVKSGSVDGVFYAPPMNTSSMCMYYNTALLEQAGVEIRDDVSPENRLTWDEVIDLAKQTLSVVNPDGNSGIYGIEFRQVSRVYQMNPIVNSLGGLNIGEDGFTVDGVLNSDEWIEGMAWYQNLVNEGIASRGVAADELRTMFAAGRVVFMIDTTSLDAYCGNNGMETWDVMPVPTFEGHESDVATGTGSWNFGINYASENKDAAADFIKWMSIGEGADLWYAGYNQLPTKVSLLESIQDDASAAESLKIAAYEAQNTAVSRALTPAFSEYQTIMNAAWEDVRNGEEVEATLNSAIEQINLAMEAYK
ncbi:MAG: sugar ABC transporter substrate-binding protein [Clostridiales bacterium]|nr:sugar ABC transporter substrate-binding protein [Clostridiales bacterium]